jgi:hypothetical protein
MMGEHFKRYAEYIQNTAQRPLAASAFDDDWEPIGPKVRREMGASGLIEEWGGALMLTEKGESLLHRPQSVPVLYRDQERG